MTMRLSARPLQIGLLLAPLLVILAARLATHSDLASRHPRAAALLFVWIAADALALALIAKAPRNRPGVRALLGAIAAGCVVATLASAPPVREALLAMPAAVAAMGLTLAAYIGWSSCVALGEWRKTGSLENAAGKVLPAATVRFVAHEYAMLRLALFSWGAAPEVPKGAKAFAYHRVINPMIGAFLMLQVIEIVVVDLLVSHWSERAAWLLLAAGIWGALFLIALMKSFRLYPVLLDQTGVRVRAGMIIDMHIPLEEIAGIEATMTQEETKDGSVLNAAILAHPNVILRLERPLEYRPFFGKPRMVTRVAFRLDQPSPFLEALETRI